jgi:hypothetical protein
LLLGDLDAGYMVLSANDDVRARLAIAAERYGVPIDGQRF